MTPEVPFLETHYTDEQGINHELQIFTLAKNARTFFCKALIDNFQTNYLHYNAFSGWKDLDHGITALSKLIERLIGDPFKIIK